MYKTDPRMSRNVGDSHRPHRGFDFSHFSTVAKSPHLSRNLYTVFNVISAPPVFGPILDYKQPKICQIVTPIKLLTTRSMLK